MKQYHLLAIHDVHKTASDGSTLGWAYWNRTTSLQQFAPPDFRVTTCQTSEIPWDSLGDVDCIYQTEYVAPQRKRFREYTDAPMVVSYNSDSRRRREYWNPAYSAADILCCNNVEIFEDRGRLPKTVCISNGVNTDVWRPTVPISERPHRALWCGSSGVTKGKGFFEVFQPLEKMLPKYGFESDFRPINDIDERIVYPQAKQVDWYNSGSYILCASLSEGTPGISLEGAACGCVLVTLAVGNVQEFGVDRENCVIVKDRTPEGFLEALEYAREHRERLSAAGAQTMADKWSYGPPGNRAAYFFQLFRRIIEDGADSIKPFRYDEISPEEI